MDTLDQFSLDGDVALITGASQGLGQAIALALAEAGADIAGLSRSQSQETKSQVEGLGRRYLPILCDLETASVQRLSQVVEQVIHEFGQLDILVNNAGIIIRRRAIEYQETDWDAVLQVNLKALFFLSQAAAKPMLKRGKGKIIQIASMLSFQGGILVPAYTAAKGGVAGLTRALANEWASEGVNVNAIAPGYFATDNTAPLREDPEREPEILSRIPAGRWGQPSELKGVAVFLASSASDYMHGSIVAVDGGWLAR